jgi:MinD-like ATPase involved in chromosome partitioning or flagellar assembly
LDSAPGLGRESLGAMKASDEVLFVTNPNVLSLTDVMRCNELCEELGIKSLGIVLNMVHKDGNEINARDIEIMTGMPVIASIPYDHKVRRSLAMNTPVVTMDPRAKSSRELIKLAAVVANEPYRQAGFFSWLKFW